MCTYACVKMSHDLFVENSLVSDIKRIPTSYCKSLLPIASFIDHSPITVLLNK